MDVRLVTAISGKAFKSRRSRAEETCGAQMAAFQRLTPAPRAVPVPTPAFSRVVIDADRPPADPLALLLRAYDRAIRACERFDPLGARNAVSVLREALDLSSPASRSFDSLYAWCDDAIQERDFVGAAQCLRTLRHAWHQAGQLPAAPATWGDLPVC